jgi:hypothetical protein
VKQFTLEEQFIEQNASDRAGWLGYSQRPVAFDDNLVNGLPAPKRDMVSDHFVLTVIINDRAIG